MGKYSLLGLAGAVLLGIGLAVGYIQGKNDVVSLVPVVLGALAIIAWLLLDLKNIFSFLGSKGFKYGTNSFVMTVVFLAILVILQIIISGKDFKYDVTENKRFTLSEQTTNILDSLEQDINVFAFVDKRDRSARDLLEQYKTRSGRIKYEIVDPNLSPGLAKQYEITSMNTIVLSSGLKQEKINEISEDKLTNAMIKLTREGQKTIYFVEGHGEKLLTDPEQNGLTFIRDELTKQNYKVESLVLLQKSEIPADASVVILPGIEKPLLAEEKSLLESYIKKGGSLMVLVDPDTSKENRDFLTNYGIRVRDDIIVDKLSRAFGGDFLMPVVPSYQETQHPVTRNLRAMTFFPLASSLETLPGENISTQVIAQTTPESWGETNKAMLEKGQAGLDPQDTRGPLPIAAISIIQLDSPDASSQGNQDNNEEKKEKTAKLLVFGDSDFIANNNIGLSGNSDLILNTVNWMAEEEDLIAIRPKDLKQTPLFLNQAQGRLLFWANIIFLPLAVILAGVILLNRRRLKTA